MSVSGTVQRLRKTYRLPLLLALSVTPTSWCLAAESDGEQVDDSQSIDEIVATGSRIRRTEFNSPVPVQIIDMDAATFAGHADLTSILQESTLAVNAPQFNNNVGYDWSYVGELVESNGGDGANPIDLRGLGTGRTLVLLNGRRLNPAGTRGTVSAVDLNTIPSSLIERIEILKDGASSVYGSDAISGVINIITRKRFEGINGKLWLNRPSDGGGEAVLANLSFGVERGDASFLFGIDYFERYPLRLGDRDWMQCVTDHVRDPDTGDDLSTVDPTTGAPKCYDSTSHSAIINFGDYPETGTQTRSIWDPVISAWRATSYAESPTDHPSADKKTIVSPVRRVSVHSFGSWPITSVGQGAEGYYELLFNNRSSEQKPGPIQYGTVFENSPWSPFYNSEGWADDIPLLIPFQNASSQDVDWLRGVVGISGESAGGWLWELSVGHGRSDGTYSSPEWLLDRLGNTKDLVEIAPGVYDCVVNLEPNADGNCVPLNPYDIIRNGSNSPEQFPQDVLDYLMVTETGSTKYEQSFLSAYMSGDLFEMPAGTAKAVFGIEGRRESINDTPDPERRAGNIRFGRLGITKGTDTVIEGFLELELPLLRNQPAAKDLTFSAAARYSDYDTAGSNTTYRVGLNWQIIDQLRLRSAYGTSFRAPALYESFLQGDIANIWFLSDPCIDFQNAPDISPNVYANCSAELGDEQVMPNRTTRLITVGNVKGLKPETADSLTAGLVFDFSEVDLVLALDYFEFTINDEIDRLGAGELVYRCYDLPPDKFRQPDTYCDFVSDRIDGLWVIDEVRDSFFNINKKYQRGIDLTLQYGFAISELQFVADVRASRILELTQEYFDGLSYDLNGALGYADLNGQFDLRAVYHDWTFYYGLDFIAGQSSYDFWSEDPETSIYVIATDDVIYHDFSVGYENDKWSLRVGVQNIADKRPPEVSRWWSSRAGNSAVNSHYDLLGRRYFLNLQTRF